MFYLSVCLSGSACEQNSFYVFSYLHEIVEGLYFLYSLSLGVLVCVCVCVCVCVRARVCARVCVCVCLSLFFFILLFFTPPWNRGGVIFSIQFVSMCVSVCLCVFRLALRGYSVASLPRRFALCARILGRFAPSKFKKKSVSIDSKGSKTHKNAKKNLPLWRASRVAQRAQRAAKRNLTYPCGRFAPSGFALATYPMTLPGSQGVSMPSFMTIRSKLCKFDINMLKITLVMADFASFLTVFFNGCGLYN